MMKMMGRMKAHGAGFFGAALILIAIFGLVAGPATAQTICQACGRCDQDGDGKFKDRKRCQDRCNPENNPLKVDPDDSDAGFCDDPDAAPPKIVTEFTDGDFVFADIVEPFTLNDRGNRAYNDEPVTLLVPVDSDPETVEDWDDYFVAACPALLAAAPPALDAGPNQIELAKSAGDVRIIFANIPVDAAFLREGIHSAQITFQLIGKDQGTSHFPTRPDDLDVDWVFTMYRIFGKSTSKGPKLDCGGPGEVLIPDGSEHTLQIRVP